jgi:hypothetical protein
VEESNSREEPLDEQTNSRRAIRECREQSLQEIPCGKRTAPATAQEALKGLTKIILLGDRAFARFSLDN